MRPLLTLIFVLLLSAASSAATVRLDELDLATATSGWGKVHANASIEGKPLTIDGTTYERGLGTHAPSRFRISLDGRASLFSAIVGLDDEVLASDEGRDRAGIEFLVFADDKEVFNSGVIKAGMPARRIEIELAGVRNLLLVVEDAGDGIGWDHADWAMAKIEYAGDPPVPTVAPRPEPYILTPRPGPAPRINGPRVFGTRPGNPFIYRIPTTGERPMTFRAENLPAGLSLDGRTGIITGNAPPVRGDYPITLHARNSHGADQRPFKLVVGDTLALTPPMGWNDWYIHYDRISDVKMRAAADQMIETGMADYGYMYVNIDDCWSKKQGEQLYRGECGRILPNDRFPDMKALTDYIHSKGLRAGIYTSPGPYNCAGYVGNRQDVIDEALLDPANNCEEFGILSAEDVAWFADRVRQAYEQTDYGIYVTLPGTAFGDIACVPAPWMKNPRGIRDVEEWYVSTALRPEYVRTVFEHQCEVALRNIDLLADALGDRVQVAFVSATDFGTQRGLFCSLQSYRDLYKPFQKAINDRIHERTNWKTFIHTCGAVRELIPDLIEAGFDVLNPVQTSAAGMDARTLKKEFGRDIVFWGGGIDTQKTMPFGSPAEVYHAVIESVEIFNDGGGFVFNSIHNVQGNVPLKNLLAMFRALRDCGVEMPAEL